MKKSWFIIISVCLFFIGLNNITMIVLADEFNEFEVKVITECFLYEEPKIKKEEPFAIENPISFWETLIVIGQEVEGEDSDFVFYPVLYKKDGTETAGFVIKNFVMRTDSLALRRGVDPNAKIISVAQVYFEKNDEKKLKIQGEDVFLEKDKEVRVIDNSDKKYKKIIFEIDNELYVGFVKSENLRIEGVDATAVFITFIFILAGMIALSIFLTTRKKRKKQRKLIKPLD